ncbi:hypothetical protein PRIPAC_80912 [Pristionchus pacificus]|uniref:Uncharacterized protein n=1 Tax=Pristionchus pacificus TaxID=54126 RepID=A0A454Y3J0_PRIPA|nr:hypothetical protein PRIPAC_80912 [Pristionchus pacificus]|eukprot:PDM79800.1 hypothetical protein PRIPAC_32379 [Pristionchus pacificus]
MVVNWAIVRKALLISSLLLFSVVFILDFLPRQVEHVQRKYYAPIIQPRDQREDDVFVPKFKRYHDDRTEKERLKSVENLGRMDLIRKANSDPLPPRAFTGSALQMCSNKTGDSVCVPKFKQLETRIRTASNYNLSTCIIQKSMSTVMTAIMCYLHNERNFTEAGREFARECTAVRFCQNKNEFAQVAGVRKEFNIRTKEETKKWRFTMITRDPIDRFLSGYVDKCIRIPHGAGYCNGCHRNMTCFILSEYDRIQTQLARGHLFRSFEDRHFFPQNWRCDLFKEYNNYRFLRYSSDPSDTLLGDLIPILEEQRVPASSIQFIRDQLNAGRTVHSTVQSEARTFYEQRLKSSPFLLEYIIRIFYYDFVLFKYPFPDGF